MVISGLSKSSSKFATCGAKPYSLPVVDGLSGSLVVIKVILFCFHMVKMKRQGSWQSLMVVNGHWDRPRVYASKTVIDCL